MGFVERLAQKRDRASLHGAIAHAVVRKSCDEDDRDLVTAGLEAFLKLDAAEPGHLHIRDQAGGPVQLLGRQELLRRREGGDVVADRPDQCPGRIPNGFVIIDYGDHRVISANRVLLFMLDARTNTTMLEGNVPYQRGVSTLYLSVALFGRRSIRLKPRGR